MLLIIQCWRAQERNPPPSFLALDELRLRGDDEERFWFRGPAAAEELSETISPQSIAGVGGLAVAAGLGLATVVGLPLERAGGLACADFGTVVFAGR